MAIRDRARGDSRDRRRHCHLLSVPSGLRPAKAAQENPASGPVWGRFFGTGASGNSVSSQCCTSAFSLCHDPSRALPHGDRPGLRHSGPGTRLVAAGGYLAVCQLGGAIGRVFWAANVQADGSASLHRKHHSEPPLAMSPTGPGFPLWALPPLVFAYGASARAGMACCISCHGRQ